MSGEEMSANIADDCCSASGGYCTDATSKEPATAGCQDGFCTDAAVKEPVPADDCLDECCAPAQAQAQQPPAPSCTSSYCSTATDEANVTGSNHLLEVVKQKDGCPPNDSAGNSGCGNSKDGPSQDCASSDAPPCCQGKASPCCDDSCLDRLALRECDESCEKPPRRCSSDSNKIRNYPCASHAKATRAKYSERLAAIGCICRALVALGQQSCCLTSNAPSRERKRGRAEPNLRISSCDSQAADDCCAEKSTGAAMSGSSKACRKRGTKQSAASGCKVTSKGKEIAGSAQPRDYFGDSCCAGNAILEPKTKNVAESVRSDNCSGDSYCAGEVPPSLGAIGVDVERAATGIEHVVLSVTGMTCTGCETKLSRTLGTFGGVGNLKTSLVMSRAVFSLDTRFASVDDAIRHVERTTEFKCEKITAKGSSVDILPQMDIKQFLQLPLPAGVDDVNQVDGDTVRISHDPKVIGARDLVEKTYNHSLQLAPLRGDHGLAAGSKHVRDMGYLTLLSAALTIPVLVLAWAPLEDRPKTYGAVSLALATIVQIVIAGPFYPKALKSLIFSKMIEMDLLIVLSTSAAYVFSVVSLGYLVSGSPLSTGEFFETSTLLVTLIMVGRYVSAAARQKAVRSISIRSLQSPTAIILADDGKSEREIDIRLLQYGDTFKLMPDAKAPTDGIVISGASETDESMITGESRPVGKNAGSSIIAGSINGPGMLFVRLTRLPNENTISAIAGMVDDAKLTKPKMQNLADIVATYFVPTVVLLTIVTFAAWIAVGVNQRHQSGAQAAVEAITFAITVLIVSCPCAIGLAVPMVIVVASGAAAHRGVIFKTAESIEVAYSATHVVFDKTGTLTEGKLSVAVDEIQEKEIMTPKILGLVANIKHPVSAAIATHLQEGRVHAAEVQRVTSVPGKGVEGLIGNSRIRGGNARWLGFESDQTVQSVLSKGYTEFCFVVDSSLVAVFGLTDSVRTDAFAVVEKLQQQKIDVSILSGDDQGPVNSVARSLNIPTTNAKARCMPFDKAAYIKTLLTSPPPPTSGLISNLTKHPKKPVVLFVGDGTNDAVALAQATLGVHISGGSGTDVAQSAADVVLMRPSLDGLLTILDTSQAAVRRIQFNFAWSFVYNVFAVLLAAGAFTSRGDFDVVRIPPEYAGLGELVSVLPVILIAVSLRWFRV